MGEKMMTLIEVRDWLREAAKHNESETTRRWYGFMANAIDAHLTQPAQAVDVGAIREVISTLANAGRFDIFGTDEQCCDLADKLTRALGNAQAEGWRPIETAPKDGTRVMLTNGHGVWMADYQPVYPSGYRPNNPWSSVLLNHEHMPLVGRHKAPTHWMPLPTPPQPEE